MAAVAAQADDDIDAGDLISFRSRRGIADDHFCARNIDELVLPFDEQTPHDLIAAIQPDVLVKGADWAQDAIVGRDIVEARGGRVVRIPLEQGYSTTAMLETIRRGG